jgi:hypothetical protein
VLVEGSACAAAGEITFLKMLSALLRAAVFSSSGAQKALLPFGPNAFQEHLSRAFLRERVPHVK